MVGQGFEDDRDNHDHFKSADVPANGDNRISRIAISFAGAKRVFDGFTVGLSQDETPACSNCATTK